MTYTITHPLGHTHGSYDTHTTAHAEVLKLIPLSVTKAGKLLNRLASARPASQHWVDYDGVGVLINVL